MPGVQLRMGEFTCILLQRNRPDCNHQLKECMLAAYKQECTDCKIMTDPYKTEKLICSHCGSQACTCTDDEKMERKRNIDLAKPHRSDLCEKCKKGMPCYR
ncbi:hypothetical protein KUTeg_018029 [Tegillarca granosa]|uniref:3CxxC-type domain-containing protein n=1 Tax=Tegillarca granosa TaxID=220873 RepID=A0ABQ9EGQ1_TEGGR|nr:hypothetical protein KUTeg_018029 [Tegillarca granosa]